MRTSENINELAQALAKAQAELQNPPKNKVNPHFNSRYVDLADGLDAIRKVFGKHGLSFVQGTQIEDGFIFLHTRLMHLSGQWLESVYPVCGPDKHQIMGSAMTYARRYSIFGLVGVAGEDDDDGEAASDAKNVQTKGPAKSAKVSAKSLLLDPEESEFVLKSMRAALDMVESNEQLMQWAKENKDNKDRLQPKHQDEITAEFKAVQKYLKERKEPAESYD